MKAISNRDTKPEMLLRRELHGRGLRYLVRTDVLGHPDLVFTKPHVAVFVDGDYWHGNTWRLRGSPSLEKYVAAHANGTFWLKKIRANIARDEEVSQRLASEGWTVVRFWESDIAGDLLRCADDVERRVRGRVDRLVMTGGVG